MAKIPAPRAAIVAARPYLSPINNEDTLDIQLVPKEISDGNQEIIDCATCIFLNGVPIEQGIDDILLTAFDGLFAEATSLRPAGSAYVTGLRMHFGLSGTKLKLLYQPVCLKYKKTNSPDEKEYDVIEGNKYYYDSGMFKNVTATQLAWPGNYKTTINLVHGPGVTAVPFINGVDTEFATFPFQVIYSLIEDNASLNTLGMYGSIRKLPGGGVNSYKHAILISPELPPPVHGPFYIKYANKSNLCPNDCASIKLSV